MDILFLVPFPIKESGGHRTILRHINYLASLGNKMSVVVDKRPLEKNLHFTREDFESWSGHLNAEILQSAATWRGDLVIATAWWTAYTAISINSSYKCYFVQDVEDRFNPAGSFSAQIEATYLLGLPTITIGEWLRRQVAKNSEISGRTPFGVDKNIYTTVGKESRKKDKVIVLEQPDKSRRCTELLIETVELLSEVRKELEIYSFGSHFSVLKRLGVRHLGSLPEHKLGGLYRSATVGICLSATNPSRVPFEMVSCGLPVVDLKVPGTSIDYESLPISRSWPRADLITEEIIQWIDGEKEFEIKGNIATIEEELAAFSDFIERVVKVKSIYEPPLGLKEETNKAIIYRQKFGFCSLTSVLSWLWSKIPLGVKIQLRRAIFK